MVDMVHFGWYFTDYFSGDLLQMVDLYSLKVENEWRCLLWWIRNCARSTKTVPNWFRQIRRNFDTPNEWTTNCELEWELPSLIYIPNQWNASLCHLWLQCNRFGIFTRKLASFLFFTSFYKQVVKSKAAKNEIKKFTYSVFISCNSPVHFRVIGSSVHIRWHRFVLLCSSNRNN